MKKLIKTFVENTLNFLGYEVLIKKKNPSHEVREGYGLNLNIGAGDYHLTDFISLDLDAEWYHEKNDSTFTKFDIKKKKYHLKITLITSTFLMLLSI